ncbi:MAG: GntP family permease [Oscillospiraceae bacterium]|nr:GntP family permease [Oscillospiraceae bacterium]
MLLLVFLISIAILLLCIIKIKLNPFVALLVCAYGTGLMALATYMGGGAPENFSSIADVTACVTSNFGSTLGSIGIVTGLGVMLGMFMYESGGIDNIVDKVLKAVGPKRSQYAVSVAGFITGIPVFGDVVYIMFAPMLRVLSRKTGYSMAAYGCAISVATTCTFALVLPTAPPLAVAAAMDINVGIFFFYALISALVGMFVGGIIYGGIVNKQDQKAGRKWDFSDLDAELAETAAKAAVSKPKMGAGMAMSILLVPILLILVGSFSAFLLPADSGLLKVLAFLGDKNVAMTIGVLYGAFISRPHLNRSITEIMTEGADKVGLILLITGAGGAYGGVLKACGIANVITDGLQGFHMPILIMCFAIAQVLRIATGSTTVALTTTAAIVSTAAATSGVSPILCAIAVCAGGIGLSLPNDSGFWAISRFFHLNEVDTIRGWTLGGFVAGVSILIFACVLSLFQGFLPGLI